MSQSRNCRFYENAPSTWFYDLEDYYQRESYETFGPFKAFGDAHRHLGDNHSNPGGYSSAPLPGCKHAKLERLAFTHGRGGCYLCGEEVNILARDEWNALFESEMHRVIKRRETVTRLMQKFVDKAFEDKIPATSAVYAVRNGLKQYTLSEARRVLTDAGFQEYDVAVRAGHYRLHERMDGILIVVIEERANKDPEIRRAIPLALADAGFGFGGISPDGRVFLPTLRKALPKKHASGSV